MWRGGSWGAGQTRVCPSVPKSTVAQGGQILTAAPLAPVRPLAPGLPCEEEEKRRSSVNGNVSVLWPHLHSFRLLPLHEADDGGYLQEVQRGRRHLEDPLHHGDPRDQQDQGYQLVRVHPKRGNDTKALVCRSLNSVSPFLSPQVPRTFFRTAIISLISFGTIDLDRGSYFPGLVLPSWLPTIFTYLCLSVIDTLVLS